MIEKIKVALLDDDNLFIEGVSSLINNTEHIEVIFKTSSPLQFIETLKEGKISPNVIIIDLNMKPINGIEVIEELYQNQINTKIIVLSSLFNSAMYGYMIKYSISAFLPKYTDKEELFEAIEEVHYNRFFINKENQQLLDEYLKHQKKNQNPWSNIALSDRETEVLTYVCKEMSTKEIAENLCITVKTVESHRSKIMEKIGCKNVIGMVIYAILNGYYVITNK